MKNYIFLDWHPPIAHQVQIGLPHRIHTTWKEMFSNSNITHLTYLWEQKWRLWGHAYHQFTANDTYILVQARRVKTSIEIEFTMFSHHLKKTFYFSRQNFKKSRGTKNFASWRQTFFVYGMKCILKIKKYEEKLLWKSNCLLLLNHFMQFFNGIEWRKYIHLYPQQCTQDVNDSYFFSRFQGYFLHELFLAL